MLYSLVERFRDRLRRRRRAPAPVLPGEPAAVEEPRESPWTEPETAPLPVVPGVHGRVGDRSGRALRGVEVSLFDTAGELLTTTETAPDGTYRIDVDGGGEYVVAARSGEREPVAELVTVNGGPAWYDLIVDGPGAATGVVRDPAGHGVVATVTLVDDRGEVVAAGRTDAAGRYELRDVAAGEYHLLVAAAGSSATTRVTVPATGSVTTEVDVPAAPVAAPN
ncbi:carboxypeptidase-like regulatory domain-containing protein [Pseudonocardia sulfidoxydans]|uniref:carboxypeptidase-like regulatory domain-containing protein n=1 Tax=Pseudonocardia sulfidoxydans TaxID=54011 RepID=UPI001FE33035|nr:carboxypeptidase-like regulatory domain-containing protein [Pseudonocardia sulfidoxydans]